MPRSSPFEITLSSAEETELRKRATKYTLPYFQVQRAKMILYAAEGMSNDMIAACLDTRREENISGLHLKLLGGRRGASSEDRYQSRHAASKCPSTGAV